MKVFRSEEFKSVSTNACIRIKFTSDCEKELNLIVLDENRNETKKHLTKCNGEVNKHFDAVYCGVYNNAKSFIAEVEGEDVGIEGIEIFDDIAEGKWDDSLPKPRVDVEEKTYGVPNKVVFIGNSLLLGMGFYGMCATDDKSDYAYYVINAIKAKNENAVFTKLHGASFERSTCPEEYEKWWNGDNVATKKPTKDAFEKDTDLVIIQLGDNVNTPGAYKFFENSAKDLIKRIRALSPNARIIWVAGWYQRKKIFGKLVLNCIEMKVPLIDIGDYNSRENQSPYDAMYLKEDGSKELVPEAWITHPGNKGMKIIANDIIEFLDL